MIRLHQLLFTTLSLLSCLSNIEAAISPRADEPLALPGLSFTESLSPAVKVTPFKVSGADRHGHGHGGLHLTLDVVKRMVEDHVNMVEVPEDALEDLLDQIKRLQDQVTEMLPQDANSQPGEQSNGQSGNVPGRLPSGETGESADDVQGLPPRPSVSIASTIGVAVSPSAVSEATNLGSGETVVLDDSDGTDGPESPQETKLSESASPEPSNGQSNLFKESSLQLQTAGSQPTIESIAESTGVPATNAEDESVSRPVELITTSRDDATAQTESTESAESTAETVDNSLTLVPGGAFKESVAVQIDGSPTQDVQTIPVTTSSIQRSELSQASGQTTGSACEVEEYVSGQPILRRNADCTWTDRSTAEGVATENSLPVSTATLAITESSDIAVATLLSSITTPVVSYSESTFEVTITTQRTQGLTTFVFTSVLTKTVTVTLMTASTSFTYLGQTNAPASVSSMLFKETEEEEESGEEEEEGDSDTLDDEGRRLAINADGKLVMEGEDDSEESVTTRTSLPESARQNAMPGTQSMSFTKVAATGLSTSLPTSSIQLSDEETLASATYGPGPSTRPLAIFKEAGANMTYHSPMPSGFKTVTKPTSSLVEGGGR